jgi:protocatechuate 3,4-dioxygenase beta subunit
MTGKLSSIASRIALFTFFALGIAAAQPIASGAQNDDGKPEPAKYAGQIVGDNGKPVAGVHVRATSRSPDGSYRYFGGEIKTDQDGRFAVDPANSQSPIDLSLPVELEFSHPDFVYAELADLNLLPAPQRNDLHIALRPGKSIAGRVTDSAGHPVAGAAVIEVIDPYGGAALSEKVVYSRATVTDNQGKYQLHGLVPSKLIIEARKPDAQNSLLVGQTHIDLQTDNPSVDLVATRLVPPTNKVIHDLFGMKLIDVDDQMRELLLLSKYDRIMVLDPGPNANRLNIGPITAGDAFFFVGNSPTKDFDAFASNLLAECQAQQKAGRTEFSVRVVYSYRPPQGEWTNTQYMTLTAADLAQLEHAVKH